MNNYQLENDEVILIEDIVSHNEFKSGVHLTLTSKRMIFEKSKGFLKKELELKDIMNLNEIKIHNDKPQISQKGSEVNIQSINKNIKLTFDGMIKANKFVTKVVDSITGTTITERSTTKIKGAINTVDDVLGINTRETIKGVVENGITGTLLKGIKKNKK